MENNKTEKPLLVTTSHRGVFFGYAVPTNEDAITLKNARMCVYWTSDLHGVLGLASTGPVKGCKIGPAVISITLRRVTSVTECSPESASNWEKGVWE